MHSLLSKNELPEAPLNSVERSRVRRRLLAWYDANRREMPWRKTTDPYAIWLSESMLQQTQVATVIPYYERFLARFPTVTDLAAAPLDDVLRLWAGLGYYARARNLHRAAKTIVDDFAGRVPDSVGKLLTLPGVGRYTAGAVASIAFDRRTPVVDGNVARVLSRVYHIDTDIKTPAGDRAIWAAASELLPRNRVGDFNQALMELGATVCLPGAGARCLTCPLQSNCQALQVGVVEQLPVKGKKTPAKNETHVVVAIERDGRHLFRRRPPNGLWGNLWELPSAVQNGATNCATACELLRTLGEPDAAMRRSPAFSVEHQLTHRSVRFEVFLAEATREPRRRGRKNDQRWIKLANIESLGLSTAMRRIVGAMIKLRPNSNGRVPDAKQPCRNSKRKTPRKGSQR